MTILDINNVTKFFGPRVVLSQVSFKVNKAEKVGLIGENGSGKSTLLKMIVGEESIDEGVIAVPGKTGIGYLAQHLSYGADNTVLEEIMSVFAHLKTLESELQEAETELATLKEVDLEKGLARYSRLAERFEREGGYQYEHKSAAVIGGLRITRLTSQQMDSLSGGEKNIVALAKVLLEEPDILLLDFADRTGKIALELKKYSKRFGEKVLFEDVDLSLTFGDHVGLLGANGTGKSTLFKEIMADGAWDNSVIELVRVPKSDTTARNMRHWNSVGRFWRKSNGNRD